MRSEVNSIVRNRAASGFCCFQQHFFYEKETYFIWNYILFAITFINAPTYDITFSSSGATLERVRVENLTRGTLLEMEASNTLFQEVMKLINSPHKVQVTAMLIFHNIKQNLLFHRVYLYFKHVKMKKMKKNLTVLAFVFISLAGFSQEPSYLSEGALVDGKTIGKLNVTSLFMKTGGLSVERIITKNLSAVAGISFMPSSSIPFVNTIASMSDADAETSDALMGIRINTFSFSPELRIYPGKGYGRGFYISPYYKYEKFGLSDLLVEFELDNRTEDIAFDGGIHTHSAGVLLGYQWLLGKSQNIIIDWTILGAHYGGSSGNFHGKYSGTLTPDERAQAQDAIDETFADLPIIKAEGKINNDNTADVTVSGPWAFLRGSVSVGFRF